MSDDATSELEDLDPADLPVKPIILLADSQLLFWRDEAGELFLDRARRWIRAERPLAAYLGASNGDRPEFFELFRGAMEGIGLTDCRHIPAEPRPADLDYLAEAHLVLLAGGDVARGWRAMKRNGVAERLIERYYGGAVLLGISAGAIQLGLRGYTGQDDSGQDDAGRDDAGRNDGGLRLFETLKLVPLLVDVHAEPDWQRLQDALPLADEPMQGLGIASGGGAVLHPDLSLEAVRRPLVEWRLEDGTAHQSLIFPGSDSGS